MLLFKISGRLTANQLSIFVYCMYSAVVLYIVKSMQHVAVDFPSIAVNLLIL